MWRRGADGPGKSHVPCMSPACISSASSRCLPCGTLASLNVACPLRGADVGATSRGLPRGRSWWSL